MLSKYYFPIFKSALLLAVTLVLCSTASAQVVRKTFTLPYDDTISRLANQRAVQSKAQQEFLRDFLREKFAKQAINNLSQDIDKALYPPDKYMLSFEVVEASILDDNSVSALVEGEVDLPGMIVALVRQNILSFGLRPPRVVFLPANVQSPSAVEKLQALAYDKLQAAKLELIDFKSLLSALATAKRLGNKIPDSELNRIAAQYGADYYIFINSQAEVRPYVDGGFISSSNFTYTLLRPGSGRVIGSGSIQERAGGSSQASAYDKSVELIASRLVNKAASQLYLSIFNDSTVSYSDSTIVNTEKVENNNVAHNGNDPSKDVVERYKGKKDIPIVKKKRVDEKVKAPEEKKVPEERVADNKISRANEAKITLNLKRLT